MSPLRCAGAIFDLDGTLVQSEHIHRLSWIQPLAELGIAVDEDVYLRDFAGRPGMQIISDHIGLEGNAAIALYNRVTDNFWQIAVDEVEPTSGLIPFLDRIASLPKAICTSAQRDSALRMLDLLDLTKRFDAIVTSSDVTQGKPEPEPFHLAAARLHLPGDQCIAFEDSVNGLVSARAAGMYCVGVGAGATVYADLADLWIEDFTDSNLPRVMGI